MGDSTYAAARLMAAAIPHNNYPAYISERHIRIRNLLRELGY